VPEWLNGTVSKTVVAVSATVGSNPTLSARSARCEGKPSPDVFTCYVGKPSPDVFTCYVGRPSPDGFICCEGETSLFTIGHFVGSPLLILLLVARAKVDSKIRIYTKNRLWSNRRFFH
jgi:hypothetical protein